MKIKSVFTKNFVLIALLIVATLIRTYKLGSIPPHLTPDEAALGYNAYSILKTGRDEYGTLLPVIFKSFGDYKPGLYIYTAIPTIALFGLNEFSTRLPSAVFGVAAVYLVYLIVARLFPGKKRFAYLAAFFLAFNPWHIYFSRGAWEINLALTLTLAGIYFFLKSFHNKKQFIYSGVFFALTFWAYQGAKLSTLIVVGILGTLYINEVMKIPRKLLIGGGGLALILLIPIMISFFTGKTGRLGIFSIFSNSRSESYLQGFLDQGKESIGSPSYYVNHTETINFARGILGRYFNHMSARFLFFEGDWQNPRHTPPNHGVLLFIDALFILAGIVYLARSKLGKSHWFIILWLVLAPLPAVLSRDQVHAVRSFNMLIPLTLLVALGFSYLTNYSKQFGHVIFTILFGLFFLNFTYFLDAYFVHLSIHNSKYWEYGYKQVVETVNSASDRYDNILVRQSYAQPYIFFLFFNKYDPAKYQAQAILHESEDGDVGQVERIDNICFCPIDWSRNRGDKGTLFVADPMRMPIVDSSDPKEFEVVGEIKYLDNLETAFRVVGVKK